jgi:hypothetical protein
MSFADLSDLPPELHVYLDFISDEHRHTIVLEHSTTPKVLSRNAALDTVLIDTLQGAQFRAGLVQYTKREEKKQD